MEKTREQVQNEVAQVTLERELLLLERTKEEVAEWKASREARSRGNRQRQRQLKQDHRDRAAVIQSCNHFQGGSVKNPRKGKPKFSTALQSALLPDGRLLIMCSNCPLRVFEPRAIDGVEKQRKGESAEQMKARVTLYKEERAEFDKLKVASEDQLTEDAARPMECGVEVTFSDKEGNPAHVPSPWDKHAQGRDNRRAAA